VDAKRKEARDAELAMRQKASTIGNIVNKSVPVSQTEVCQVIPAQSLVY
jgi:seryl-tRNA synthetase